MKRSQKRRMLSLLVVCALFLGSLSGANIAKAGTIGKGARIIVYGEEGQARFHLGDVVGDSVQLTAEATGEKELTNIQFTSSNTSVCGITKVGAYWEVTRLKEGTAVITMTCKVDDDDVERSLLMSNLTPVGSDEELVTGVIKNGTTVYYGCSDVASITSKSTEIKTVTAGEMSAIVAYQCGDFYRMELEDDTFGDSEEYWGYVKKTQVTIPVTQVEMKEELTFFEKETVSLDTKIFPVQATNRNVTYTISNTNVASISADGKVTGLRAGSAVVTATSVQNPSLSSKCRITVKPYIPVTGIKVIPDKTEIDDGYKGKVTVSILPSNASIQDFSWKISDESLIKINSKGRYEALKPGTVTISAISKEGGFTDSCQITIKPVPATGVMIQEKLDIDVGEIKSPMWSMIPSTATNKNVTWRSDNPSIATVDKMGRIVGIKNGTTTIHIKTEDGGFVASCKVNVHIYVDDIELDNNDITMTLGKEKQLNPTITPENTTRQKIVWNSKNKSVVSVNQTGKVKALKTGEAEVVVYDRYTGAFDFCLITVKANLKKPVLKGKKDGKKYKLSWKKVARATGYVVYEYDKKEKKFVKIKTLGKKKRKYTVSKAEKGARYKLRAYYEPNDEFSKYSDEKEVK